MTTMATYMAVEVVLVVERLAAQKFELTHKLAASNTSRLIMAWLAFIVCNVHTHSDQEGLQLNPPHLTSVEIGVPEQHHLRSAFNSQQADVC